MIVDAHAHLGDAREQAARKNVYTVLCGTDPAGAERVLKLRECPGAVSCGLHPWNAERYDVADMLPMIQASPVLGEIGLDSVWTDADMGAQRRAFRQQLELAQSLGKPVVLHTKGMEEEIARTIAAYDVRKLVHWYSCDEFLELYLEQDCWFSVGPDYAANPAVQAVIRRAPLNRLLTETDGMSAVSWALGREVAPEEVEAVLRGELRAIARAREISEAEAERIVEENLFAFLKGQPAT